MKVIKDYRHGYLLPTATQHLDDKYWPLELAAFFLYLHKKKLDFESIKLSDQTGLKVVYADGSYIGCTNDGDYFFNPQDMKTFKKCEEEFKYGDGD